jgi:nucleotide-binding universal stress UspA family protein
MERGYQIVVGVDGSEGGRRALAWALREALSRGATVQAVMAWRWDDVADAMSGSQAERARAADMLRHEIEALPAYQRAGVTIASEEVEGRAADVLTAAARNADLLVLGSHGHSRVRHTVLGSVSEECVGRATCPVVVIPVLAPEPAAEPVVHH